MTDRKEHIVRSDEVEEGRVFHQVRFRPNIVKKTSVVAFGERHSPQRSAVILSESSNT
jgi:hypothetical protein